MSLFHINIYNFATIKLISFINMFIGTLADVEIEKIIMSVPTVPFIHLSPRYNKKGSLL